MFDGNFVDENFVEFDGNYVSADENSGNFVDFEYSTDFDGNCVCFAMSKSGPY